MNSIPHRLVLLCMGAAVSLSAGPALTLIPADLAGTPGSTVGWGFTIQNDAGYIEITSSQFCLSSVNFPLLCPSTFPTTGTYIDIISTPPEDVILGPPGALDAPSSVTQDFNASTDMGVASFLIDPGATPGDSDVGQIVLTYNLSDLNPNNPNYDPNVDLIATDVVLSADASVTVLASATPEPVTAGLLAVALLAMGIAWRKGEGIRHGSGTQSITEEPQSRPTTAAGTSPNRQLRKAHRDLWPPG
jgi:hypothetical protein